MKFSHKSSKRFCFLLIYDQLSSCSSEPDGAPQNVKGQNTSSTSISVSWEAIQADLQNGIITGYNITYQSQTENDNGFVKGGPKDLQANLTGLKEFVKYNISVVAFTVKGDGPPSIIVVRTGQDRKLFLFFLFLESYHPVTTDTKMALRNIYFNRCLQKRKKLDIMLTS